MSTPDTRELSITADLTLEVWALTFSTGTPAYPSHYLISKWRSGGTTFLPRSYGMEFRWDGAVEAQGRIHFSVCPDGLNGSSATSLVTPAMTVGTWHHVAVVYRASAGEASFYFDGAPLGSGAGLATSVLDGSAPLIIGGIADAASTEPNLWNGRLAEVRVWSVARTAAEIADNRYVRLAPQPGLVGYWPLGDGTDVSGYGHHVTASGDATFVSDSPF
ncbi:MAG: LamG domain-containing protein [Phycisphaerales bacterium]|nr:LamG domain-containing protein [Phycisphaerales bacterium]